MPANLGPVNLRRILNIHSRHSLPALIEPISSTARKLISITCNKGFFENNYFFIKTKNKVETSYPILDINHALFRLRENEIHAKFKRSTIKLRHTWHHALTSRRLQFPETRLIQYDCGKLQVLYDLIFKLKPDGHRALIFTQMSRMLDVLEKFLSYHSITYRQRWDAIIFDF